MTRYIKVRVRMREKWDVITECDINVPISAIKSDKNTTREKDIEEWLKKHKEEINKEERYLHLKSKAELKDIVEFSPIGTVKQCYYCGNEFVINNDNHTFCSKNCHISHLIENHGDKREYGVEDDYFITSRSMEPYYPPIIEDDYDMNDDETQTFYDEDLNWYKIEEEQK